MAKPLRCQFFHPLRIGIDPALHVFSGCRIHLRIGVKEIITYLKKPFGLRHGRHIKKGQDIAQVLLRHGRSIRTNGCAQYACGLSSPDAFAIWTGPLVKRIFQYTGNGAVVLGRDEDHPVGGLNGSLELPHTFRRVALFVLIEQGQIDVKQLQAQFGRSQFDQRLRQLPTTTAIAYCRIQILLR